MVTTQQTRDVDPMLGQRHGRWTNIGPTLGQCIVIVGSSHVDNCVGSQSRNIILSFCVQRLQADLPPVDNSGTTSTD